MNDTILMVLTGHDRLGDTGRATGFNVPEAAHPWRAFRAAGYRVDFATPGTGLPKPDDADRSDAVQQEFLDDPDVRWGLTEPLRPKNLDGSSYRAVFYVGGHGTMWDFPGDADLAGLARDVYEAGGVIGAVCHGPAGLVDVTLSDGTHLVAGRELTSFTDSEERAVEAMDVVPFALESRLVELGARHRGAADFAANTVVDGRLVTGQNPASAPGTGAAVVRVLKESGRSVRVVPARSDSSSVSGAGFGGGSGDSAAGSGGIADEPTGDDGRDKAFGSGGGPATPEARSVLAAAGSASHPAERDAATDTGPAAPTADDGSASEPAEDDAAVPAPLGTIGESVDIGPSGMVGYLARPSAGGPHPAVLVGFEIFGVTRYLRRMADRIAELGFVALVPDFYHRQAPGIALAADEPGRSRGLALMGGLSRDSVGRDLDEARDWLLGRAEVSGLRGMVGFSLGGHIAVFAAARLGLAAVAAYYPGWLTGTDIALSTPEPTIALLDAVPGRVLVLVGENDHLIDAAERERIAGRFEGTAHELVVFPGAPHGFACEERESHRAEAAAQAWGRVERLLVHGA